LKRVITYNGLYTKLLAAAKYILLCTIAKLYRQISSTFLQANSSLKLSPSCQFVEGSAASALRALLDADDMLLWLRALRSRRSRILLVHTLHRPHRHASPFQLENAYTCSIFQRDLRKDFSDKPAAVCAGEAARRPPPV